MGERGHTELGTSGPGIDLLRAAGAVGWVLDPSDFSVRLLDGRALAWLGHSAKRWLQPWFLPGLLDAADRELLHAAVSGVMRDGQPRELEVRARTASGGTVDLWIRLGRSPSGAHACCLAIERAGRTGGREARARAEAVEERAAQRLRAYHEMSRLLTCGKPPSEVATQVAREIGLLLGWKVGAIWMFDVRRRRLTCVEHWLAPGFPAPAFEADCRALTIHDGEGLLGTARQERRSIWVSDLARESGFIRAESVARDGIRSGVLVPICSGRDDVRGVLEYFSDEVRAPDEDMLRMLEIVGFQLAQHFLVRKSEQLARESDARRRAIVEASLNSVVAVDEEGRIVDFNPSAERLFGYRRDEVMGRRFDELLVPERYRERVRREFRSYIESGESVHVGRCIENVAMRRDGTEFPVELMVAPICVESGRELLGVMRDLTEQKRSRSELLYQKCLLEAQNEASQDGILVVDQQGVVLSFNQRFLEMWGLSEETIMRRSDREALEGVLPLVAEPERFLDRIAWLYAHPEERGLDEILLRDGRTIERYTSPVRSREGAYFGRVWFFHDVTARKRAEQRERLITREQTARVVAEEAQRRMAFLANASNVLAATLDYDSLLQLAAHVPLSELADWTVLDVVEDSGPRRAAVVHSDPEKELQLQELRAAPVPERGVGIAQVLHDHAPLLFTELDSAALANGPFGELPAEVAAAVKSVGVRSCMVVPLLLRDELLGILTLVSAREGMRYSTADLQLASDLAHRMAVAIDHARLYQAAQRSIRSRDEFLSVASHELRTPITSLQLAVQSAVRHFKPGANTPEQLERLQRALLTAGKQAQRLTRLIDALLDASRAQAGKLQLELSQVDLSALAREVVGVYMEDLVAAGCEVTIVAPEPLVGLWDRGRLEQVITNLLSNAMKYGAGKPIEVEVSRRGPMAVLAVTDHGIGIDEAKKERIFERFVRAVSGPRYSGLGLGLYIVRRIIDASGGAVEVESEVGRGSTFRVLLPLQGPPVESGAAGSEAGLH